MNNLPIDKNITSKQKPSLSFDQYTDIMIKKTNNLVNQLIEKRGNDKPPFLSQEYADMLGIHKIIPTNLKKNGAILLRSGKGYVIKVNSNDNILRQNFSCAHEVGHILLDEINRNSYLRTIEFRTFNPQASMKYLISKREDLCDIAASELLMPEHIFKRYLINNNISIYSLEKLASIFNTSIQSTARRMAEISPKVCIAIVWKPQRKANSKALKLAWKVGPGRKSSKGIQYFIVDDTAPSNSTIFKAFQENIVTESYKEFKTNNETKRLHIESKGFGNRDIRYVISLALPKDDTDN